MEHDEDGMRPRPIPIVRPGNNGSQIYRLPRILNDPPRGPPPHVVGQHQPLQPEPEDGAADHDPVGEPEHDDVAVEHDVQHLGAAEHGPGGAVVERGGLDEHQRDAQPEEREEAVERALGGQRVLAVEGREALGEDEVAQPHALRRPPLRVRAAGGPRGVVEGLALEPLEKHGPDLGVVGRQDVAPALGGEVAGTAGADRRGWSAGAVCGRVGGGLGQGGGQGRGLGRRAGVGHVGGVASGACRCFAVGLGEHVRLRHELMAWCGYGSCQSRNSDVAMARLLGIAGWQRKKPWSPWRMGCDGRDEVTAHRIHVFFYCRLQQIFHSDVPDPLYYGGRCDWPPCGFTPCSNKRTDRPEGGHVRPRRQRFRFFLTHPLPSKKTLPLAPTFHLREYHFRRS